LKRGILFGYGQQDDVRFERLTPRFNQFLILSATLLTIGLAVLAWIPNFLLLREPGADQVWEEFGIWSACVSDRFNLGWAGADSSSGLGAFTATLPATLTTWLSCQLAHHSSLNALQSYLAIGLALTFLLTLVSCRLAGFHLASSLLTAFLITTAPCAFSRVGHLSLATLWPVIPGLLASHALWRVMLPASSSPSNQPERWRSLAGIGALTASLCFPAQDYYLFFIILLTVTSYLLLLFLATTHTTDLSTLQAIAGRGLAFLLGGAGVLFIFLLPKLLVTGAGGGPPADWATPRLAGEQFLYGLLPFTWLIPSPWVPLLRTALAESGIQPSTESYFWSTGSFLIPIAWMTAIWQLARPAVMRPPREVRFYALLLALVTAVGLLWMTMGGVGTVFAVVVSPVLRSLNRYTVFVYGASVLLLAAMLDAELLRRSGARRQPREAGQ
jgi:phosphoglycerol transferase